jgi:hypothetical protein
MPFRPCVFSLWSDDLRDASSASAACRSGELGADAILVAREMFRKGEDLRGPAELRFDLRDDEATPPTLLADCGVLELSRFWTVRPMPGDLGS